MTAVGGYRLQKSDLTVNVKSRLRVKALRLLRNSGIVPVNLRLTKINNEERFVCKIPNNLTAQMALSLINKLG